MVGMLPDGYLMKDYKRYFGMKNDSEVFISFHELLKEGSVLECNSTRKERDVEVRGIRHLSVHNLKKKRETNRMKWVRVSLCVISLWHLTDLCVMTAQRTVTIQACHIVGLVTDYQIHIRWF